MAHPRQEMVQKQINIKTHKRREGKTFQRETVYWRSRDSYLEGRKEERKKGRRKGRKERK